MLLLLMLIVLVLPGPLLTIYNFYSLILKKERPGWFEPVSFSLGIVFMVLLYLLWRPRPWDESIVCQQDLSSLHEPLSREHMLTVIVLFAVGAISYKFLKDKKEKAAPLAKVLAMAGAYIGIAVILLLFGQKPDSAIRAFTETSDWTLSAKISPPEILMDSHYLCTVALRGHEKLVRPTRMGLRRGGKIVVNRQLCVANAFEQLLEERTPRFHRAVRKFYDTCGYPVSRHIRTPLAADAVYLIMKPLEWLFVAVLYLFDEKPENRIAVQYLPRIKKSA